MVYCPGQMSAKQIQQRIVRYSRPSNLITTAKLTDTIFQFARNDQANTHKIRLLGSDDQFTYSL